MPNHLLGQLENAGPARNSSKQAKAVIPSNSLRQMKNHIQQITMPTMSLITPGQAMLAFEWWNQRSFMEELYRL